MSFTRKNVSCDVSSRTCPEVTSCDSYPDLVNKGCPLFLSALPSTRSHLTCWVSEPQMQTCKERTGKDHGRNKRTCLSDLKTPFDFLFHPISFTCLAVLPSVCVFFGFSVGLSPCQAFRPVFCPFGFFDLFLYFGIFWSFSF